MRVRSGAVLICLVVTACTSGSPRGGGATRSPGSSPSATPSPSRTPERPNSASPSPSAAGRPTVFAAVRGREVVLANAATGRVFRVVHRVGAGEVVTQTHLAPDGSVWFSVYDLRAGGHVVRVPPAGQAETVSPGCAFAVSPDGRRIAYAGDERSCTSVVGVADVDGRNRTTWNTSRDDDQYSTPAWTWNGAAVMLVYAQPEGAGNLVRFDPARRDGPRAARRVGPPSRLPAGTGWYHPVATADGRVAVVQNCCALDAGTYDGGTYLLDIRDSDGRVLATRRLDLESGVASSDADRSGRHLLLSDYKDNVWYRAPGGRISRLATGLRAASW